MIETKPYEGCLGSCARRPRTAERDWDKQRFCSPTCARRYSMNRINAGLNREGAGWYVAGDKAPDPLLPALLRYGLKGGRGLPGMPWTDLVSKAEKERLQL